MIRSINRVLFGLGLLCLCFLSIPNKGSAAFAASSGEVAGSKSAHTSHIMVDTLPSQEPRHLQLQPNRLRPRSPNADAGSDQTVCTNVLVTLDGRASSDPDGDTLTYSWTQTAGPNDITLVSTGSAQPTFTIPLLASDTSYTFSLTVSDPTRLTDTDTVVIKVKECHTTIQQQTQSVITQQLEANATLLTADSPKFSDRIQALNHRCGCWYRDFAADQPLAVPTNLQFQSQQDEAAGHDFLIVTLDTSLGRMANFSNVHSGLGISDLPTDIWVKVRWTEDKTLSRESSNSLAYIGLDYQFAPTALVGFLAQVDAYSVEDKTLNHKGSGQGWMLGPYVASKGNNGLNFDARLAWGQADNQVSPTLSHTDSFKSERWLASVSVAGHLQGIGSLQGFDVEPELEVIHYKETQEAYVDTNGVKIPETELEMTRVNFGPTVRNTVSVDDETTLSFHAGVKGVWTDIASNLTHPTTGFTNPNRDNLTAKLEAGVQWNWKHKDGNITSLKLETSLDGFLDQQTQTQSVGLRYSTKF